MHIAIQGDPLSFHELAAKQYYSPPVTFEYCQTFQDVFRLLDAGKVDRGFVAVRNSGHGAIKEVSKLFKAHSPQVEAEHSYSVLQHLVGTKDADLASIKTVISHPVALSQCREYLTRYDNQQTYHDTAAAMRLIQELNDPTIAAVGGAEAATYYGLQILVQNIQDDPQNHTVFASILSSKVGNAQ